MGIVKVFSVAFMLLWPVAAAAKEMDFVLQEKDLRPNLDLFQWIYADGEITPGTADRFRAFVNAHPQLIGNATVIFNSPGGSLIEGLQLGEAISEKHFRTDVAVSGSEPMTRKPGICASACVFSYLGGQYRYLTAGSQIGIHRFSFTKATSGDIATSASQLMAGRLVNFVGRMRADTALFTLMTQTSSEDIRFLSLEQLTSLKVVNNDVYSETWSYEVRDNIPYLKADQVTWRGENKLMFICQTGSKPLPFVMSMSELPDREMVISEAKQLVLFVDHRAIYLPMNESRPTMEGGRYVSWSFTLSQPMINAIERATTIGSGISPAPGIFSGFEAINIGEGRSKVVSFLEGCKPIQESATATPTLSVAPNSVPSDLAITRRVAHNFDTQYKKSGSIGLQLSVSTCYASVSKNHKIGSLEYCYLLDRVSSSTDVAITKRLGYSQTPFWAAENVQARAAKAFVELGQPAGIANQAMTRWQNLEPLIWSQLAALPK